MLIPAVVGCGMETLLLLMLRGGDCQIHYWTHHGGCVWPHTHFVAAGCGRVLAAELALLFPVQDCAAGSCQGHECLAHDLSVFIGPPQSQESGSHA